MVRNALAIKAFVHAAIAVCSAAPAAALAQIPQWCSTSPGLDSLVAWLLGLMH